jgi:hypothetical protein
VVRNHYRPINDGYQPMTENSIWQIVAGTPWWVYVLFIYLMRLGFYATKSHIIPVKKIFIMPMIFLVLSIVSMFGMALNAFNLSIWVASILVGAVLGWLQYKALRIKAVKNKASLYVPGTWSLLIIITLIFSIKYYFGYTISIDPNVLMQPQYTAWILGLYGLFSGLFIGRLTYALRCIKVGPFVMEEALAKSPLH